MSQIMDGKMMKDCVYCRVPFFISLNVGIERRQADRDLLKGQRSSDIIGLGLFLFDAF